MKRHDFRRRSRKNAAQGGRDRRIDAVMAWRTRIRFIDGLKRCKAGRVAPALPNIMNIVINPTVEDGSIRAAAILRTQDDLRRALIARSAQLDDVAWQTLVQTSIGVRTLGALVADAVEYDDASARLAMLIEQSRQCGLSTVSEGLLCAASQRHARIRAAGLAG